MSEALAHPDVAAAWQTAERPDLRRGVWTRLGGERVLGDGATEAVLGRLAERTVTAAQAQGYAVGWAEGQRAALRRGAEASAVTAERAEQAEQRRAREHAAAIAGLRAAAAAVADSANDVATQIAEQATELAFEVVHTLLGHELAAASDPGPGVVGRVLAVLPKDPTTSVRLHPTTMTSAAVAELAEHGVALIPDVSLDLHDAVVETSTTAIDLRLALAVDRLREALT
ncbi:FliH/SctL family protein [Nocardioides sp. URHA0020]|uniref:FliH/SctL family protein n=1 Tax=Nocardioides sp. URHA0020 TaxID=1380392 RepID=UPI000491C53C|nr:FliH/SctL family protein [Nocardioides sp. URHA0020]